MIGAIQRLHLRYVNRDYRLVHQPGQVQGQGGVPGRWRPVVARHRRVAAGSACAGGPAPPPRAPGARAGAAGRRASLNVAYYREMADRVLSEAGIAERGPLTAFDATRVDEVVDSFVPDELYRAHRSMLAADGEVCWFGQDAPWTAKFVRRVRKALQRRLEALERRLGGSA